MFFKAILTFWLVLVNQNNIVITRAERIMAENSQNPRAQPEDEDYFRHNI